MKQTAAVGNHIGLKERKRGFCFHAAAAAAGVLRIYPIKLLCRTFLVLQQLNCLDKDPR